MNYNEAQSLFYSGKAAMFPTGAWLIGSIEQAMGGAKSPVGLFPYPGPTGPGILTTVLSSGLFISAKTQHLAAAEKFLEFEGGNSATAKAYSNRATCQDTLSSFRRPHLAISPC